MTEKKYQFAPARQSASSGRSGAPRPKAAIEQYPRARPRSTARPTPSGRNTVRKPLPRRIRARRRRRLFLALLLCFVLAMAIRILLPRSWEFQGDLPGSYSKANTNPSPEADIPGQTYSDDAFSQELQKLLELNAETKDYVEGYPDRGSYINGPIDLTEDFVSGQVPLLMQWDKRWGYDAYGDSMIGLAGCGPLCMTQAYLYFTEDTRMNPKKIADFAYDNGYYTPAGTSWSLWTDGAKKLGLSGRELSLNQNLMQRALDAGELIVCSMGPGDFTTVGHFILIRGYDENGFYVNDPNRKSNSSRQWDFDTLQYQIRNLWALSCPS